MKKNELSRALTNMYCDRIENISKKTIMVYSRTENLDEIQNVIDGWEHAGYLQILKSMKDCENSEPCIRLLKMIPLPIKPN